MSHNVYRDDEEPRYRIPGWGRPSVRAAAQSGLAYDVYDRRSSSGEWETVVAFRGSVRGSVMTNLSLVEPRQYREARKDFERLVADRQGRRIRVTGHSLGGAISLAISHAFPGVDAIAFNSSPRTFAKRPYNNNRRIHIFEEGEFLANIRPAYRSELDYIEWKYDFLTRGWMGMFEEHGMYHLTRGLLLSAIPADTEGTAREAFIENIERERALEVDPDECGRIYPADPVGAPVEPPSGDRPE